jgi:hypothetical protein
MSLSPRPRRRAAKETTPSGTGPSSSASRPSRTADSNSTSARSSSSGRITPRLRLPLPRPHDVGEQTQGVDNDELRRRYTAGEPLTDLAEAANMTVNGLQIRLRRIGVPARRSKDKAHQLNEDQIRNAIHAQQSVAGAARQLGVGRAALAARAQQLGVLPPPAGIPTDLAQRYQDGDSVRVLASTYGVGPTTITRWLDAAGVPRRPRGRQAKDG